MGNPADYARDDFIDNREYPDLTPPGQNISGRVVKNLRICGSGIYEYHQYEVSGLIAEAIPEEHRCLEIFGVYRPGKVLADNAGLFARLPITVEHPDEWVTLENGAVYTRGLTGDYVETREEEDGETYLYTTGTLFDDEAVKYYQKYQELSCGYKPLLKWENGEWNGKRYQLVMYGLADANHVALVRQARGGRMIKVLDGKNNLLEKIRRQKGMKSFDFIARAFGAKDAASKVKEAFNHAHNAEDIGQVAEFVKPYLDKVKACDGKAELEGYLNDLRNLGGEDKDVFVKCRNYTRDLAVSLVRDSAEPPPKKGESAVADEGKEKESEDGDESGKNDKTLNAANDEAEKIERAVDAAVAKAMDAVMKTLDERFPKTAAKDGDDGNGGAGAKDGDPNMDMSDRGKGARDEAFTSDSLMDILRGGKR
jgi:hypothetical protein